MNYVVMFVHLFTGIAKYSRTSSMCGEELDQSGIQSSCRSRLSDLVLRHIQVLVKILLCKFRFKLNDDSNLTSSATEC